LRRVWYEKFWDDTINDIPDFIKPSSNYMYFQDLPLLEHKCLEIVVSWDGVWLEC
jgi:hypothetical protein